jgi:hypothetical protein
MGNAYLEQYEHSQPDMDQREAALQQATLDAGLPIHDLRAVDMVERALLNIQNRYRTSRGIEKEVCILPRGLIAAILKDTPSIARVTPFAKVKDEYVYAHRNYPGTIREGFAFWSNAHR